MAGKPAEPEDSEHASSSADVAAPGLQGDGSEHVGAPPGGAERIGPVTIARLVKEDGRALIVYTRETSSHP
jgi:hypothetical protein